MLLGPAGLSTAEILTPCYQAERLETTEPPSLTVDCQALTVTNTTEDNTQHS